MEGYLARKWNLVPELDNSHSYKNGGIMDGTPLLFQRNYRCTPVLQLSELDLDYNASWTTRPT